MQPYMCPVTVYKAPKQDRDKLDENHKNIDSIAVEDTNDNEQEIQKLININELQDCGSDFVSSIEWSQNIETPKPIVRDKWYQNYSLDESYASWSDPNSKQVAQIESPLYKVDEVVSAIEAIHYRPGTHNLDIRPKIYDKLTKTWTLIDSGSCVSCTPKQPEDQLDENFK